MKTKVKKWYLNKHRSDSLGKSIKGKLTFAALLQGMEQGKDIYDMIGVDDSIVRERVMVQLARLTSRSYDDIYNLWLSC